MHSSSAAVASEAGPDIEAIDSIPLVGKMSIAKERVGFLSKGKDVNMERVDKVVPGRVVTSKGDQKVADHGSPCKGTMGSWVLGRRPSRF